MIERECFVKLKNQLTRHIITLKYDFLCALSDYVEEQTLSYIMSFLTLSKSIKNEVVFYIY